MNTEEEFKILDKYFANLNLDKELNELTIQYNMSDDRKKLRDSAYLNELRSNNHYRYHNIDFIKLDGLTEDINVYVRSIKDLYKLIDPKVLLTENEVQANQHKIVLDNIYSFLDIIDEKVDVALKLLTPNNNIKQAKLSIELFKKANVPKKVLDELIDLYSEIKIISSYLINDKYEDLKNQIKRKRNISRIYNLLNVKEPRVIEIDKSEEIDVLNKRIDRVRRKYMDKIQYLGDILPKGKEFKTEYERVKNSILVLFSYDDRNMLSARKVWTRLQNNQKMDSDIKDLEETFIEEIERVKKEKKFVFDKIGLKNVKRTLDYIEVYYFEQLDDESKEVITYIQNNIKAGKYNAKNVNEALRIIVDDIWKKTITSVKDFNCNKDYYFLCTNNPFIDEKYQTILITKKEILKVNDYEDYQIGFICKYNSNIIYATENEDIMSVRFDDMSNLKTPKQIEDEFINFKVCNRIALNGFKTRLEAVYYIDDGDEAKLKKAIDLSNSYELPLIKLIKET